MQGQSPAPGVGAGGNAVVDGGAEELLETVGGFEVKGGIVFVAEQQPLPFEGAGEHEFVQPGRYEYVNHNLVEAMHLGALGEIHVDGAWNGNLMSVGHEARQLGEG